MVTNSSTKKKFSMAFLYRHDYSDVSSEEIMLKIFSVSSTPFGVV